MAARGPDGDWYDDDPDTFNPLHDRRQMVVGHVPGHQQHDRRRRMPELERMRRYGVDARGNRKQGTT